MITLAEYGRHDKSVKARQAMAAVCNYNDLSYFPQLCYGHCQPSFMFEVFSKISRLLCLALISTAFIPAAHADNPVKAIADKAKYLLPENEAEQLAVEECMRNLVIDANPEQTIDSLRSVCRRQILQDGSTEVPDDADEILPEPRDTALERRRQSEASTQLNPFVITAHRPSYVMPVSYNRTPDSRNLTYAANRFESKFQLSFKMPLWIDAMGSGASLYFAYTGQSYWQIFKEANSRPFRETNHEPELFVEYDLGYSFQDVEFATVRLGFVHESNGRDIPESRSWNRFYVSTSIGWENWFVQLRPWIRIQEDARTDPNDPDGDDNPNIEEFVGQAEVIVAYRWENHTLSGVFKNSFRGDYRGSVELGYSYPINDRLRGYVQYFNGYGESLIDYDQSSHRLGIGVLLTDWL